MRTYEMALAFSLILFVACSNTTEDRASSNEKPKGDVHYGGVFSWNELSSFGSLFPHATTDQNSSRIATQIYEGLVKLNPSDLTIVPALAERWEVNEDATKFTFYLRKGVFFHDNACFPKGEGREVVAEDFKYCFTKLCEFSEDNALSWILQGKVKGASNYYASSAKGTPLEQGVEGIKVLDNYTLEISLEYPMSGFLNILAHPGCFVFPHEAYELYKSDIHKQCVGTGPFCTKKVKEDLVILQRNDRYWKFDEFGNRLPYLNAIRVTFVDDKSVELSAFKAGYLDMVFQVPVEQIDQVFGNLEDVKKGNTSYFQIQTTPSLFVQYYGFQHHSEVFGNKWVRKAFNHAVDRAHIATYVLQGQAVPANHGIVPPAFSNYPYEQITGFDFNVEKARECLKKAGYPNGKGFPKLTLQLNSGGKVHVKVAEAAQKMLEENLNVNIELTVLPFQQHLKRFREGKALFWRAGWAADYPDPENFLNYYSSKHVPLEDKTSTTLNTVRYSSTRFDSLLNLALRETNEKKRMELFAKADQHLIDDAVVLPLYFNEHTRLLQNEVAGFPINPMEYRDFSAVHFTR